MYWLIRKVSLMCQWKTEKKHTRRLLKWAKIDYTTDNLLDYEYFSNHNKLIAIDLTKQTELENPDLKQKINFISKLEGNWGATQSFSSLQNQKKQLFNFHKTL